VLEENYKEGEKMMNAWIKPEFIEVSVNAECTAYSYVDDVI
jgi:coenzyme PQQ precursor peptide PqqA